jgi:hypothetical protein
LEEGVKKYRVIKKLEGNSASLILKAVTSENSEKFPVIKIIDTNEREEVKIVTT